MPTWWVVRLGKAAGLHLACERGASSQSEKQMSPRRAGTTSVSLIPLCVTMTAGCTWQGGGWRKFVGGLKRTENGFREGIGRGKAW